MKKNLFGNSIFRRLQPVASLFFDIVQTESIHFSLALKWMMTYIPMYVMSVVVFYFPCTFPAGRPVTLLPWFVLSISCFTFGKASKTGGKPGFTFLYSAKKVVKQNQYSILENWRVHVLESVATWFGNFQCFFWHSQIFWLFFKNQLLPLHSVGQRGPSNIFRKYFQFYNFIFTLFNKMEPSKEQALEESTQKYIKCSPKISSRS